jgi:hypothetical protein
MVRAQLDQRSISAGELFVVGDQAGESSQEWQRSGVGAFAAHRVGLVDRAGDGDDPRAVASRMTVCLSPSSS